MRLIKRRLVKVPLFAAVEKPSEYVGTERNWEPAGTVFADVQPVENKQIIEIYGERVNHMKTLYCEKSADIQIGYGAFSLLESEPEFHVISVMDYPDHRVALAEKCI